MRWPKNNLENRANYFIDLVNKKVAMCRDSKYDCQFFSSINERMEVEGTFLKTPKKECL